MNSFKFKVCLRRALRGSGLRFQVGCLLILFAFNSVDGFAGKDLRERVYLQTDKHLYLAGEPILVKLLTTDTEQIPIVFSKIVYVELVGDSIALLQIKVELTNGTGTGHIMLPVNLPAGYYRLIAYTQFMKNEGIDVFFKKNIAIVNTFQSDYHPAETEEHNLPPAGESDDFGTVSLQPDKPVYLTRARGELLLNGLPENIHTLSVSIAGKDFLPVAESDISLLRKNLTKKPADFSGEFLPEYEGPIITGKIIENETGKSEAGDFFLAPGIAFPGKEIRFFAGRKNEKGDVRFITSGISGTTEIATVVYDADDKYRVDIESPFITRYASEQMPALRIDSAYYGQMLERSVALQLFHYFSEEPSENQNVPESFFKLKPNWSYIMDEYTRFTTMREVFIEFVTGARFRRNAGKWEISVLAKIGDYYNYGVMPLVLLDGTPVSNHDIIFNYDPLTVEKINIYYGQCLFGGYIFDGIVEIVTYRRQHQNLNLNKSSQVLSYNAPQLPYRLNTPDYSDDKNARDRKPDSRHTLLWNPDVEPDGKTAILVPFDTSDLTGEFQATVEGITKDGKIIFATSVFNVER